MTRACVAAGLLVALVPAGAFAQQCSVAVGARPGIETIGGYAGRLSHLPGDTVELHVSSPDGGYRIEVARYGAFDDPAAVPPALLVLDGGAPGARSTDFGSYVEIDPYAPDPAATGLTFEVWINPRPLFGGLIGYTGAVIASHGKTNPNALAFALQLGADRRVGFYLAPNATFDSNRYTWSTTTLPLEQWSHVAVTWDGATKAIFINGVAAGTEAYAGGVLATTEPIRIGGYLNGNSVEGHVDGTIDGVAAYSRPLSATEVLARYNAGRAQPTPAPLSGAYFQLDFNEAGDVASLTDSVGKVNARVRNFGTRAVAGPADAGTALKLCSDDFRDVGWPVTDTFVIPTSWPSGLYYARLIEARTSGATAYVPFIVRPPSPRARLAVIAPTNTWTAYNPWPGAYGAYGTGMYTAHVDNSPSYFAPTLRPHSLAAPNQYYLVARGNPYAHLILADRFLYSWLEKQGIAFDLYADEDLHEGRVPAGYGAWVIAGHSEYLTDPMLDRITGYLAGGGNLLHLSGNTAYWHTTFDPQTRALEVRKVGAVPAVVCRADAGAMAIDVPPTERRHAQTGQPAGVLRSVRAGGEAAVLGVGTIGMVHQEIGLLRVTNTNHWLFADAGISVGDVLGVGSRNGGGVIGHEFDGVLPGLSPASGIETFGEGVFDAGTDLQTLEVYADGGIALVVGGTRAGMFGYWNHPGGGGVLLIPSIAATGALDSDAKLSALVRNAISRFTALAPDAGDAGDAGDAVDSGATGAGGGTTAGAGGGTGGGNTEDPPPSCGCATTTPALLLVLLGAALARRARRT